MSYYETIYEYAVDNYGLITSAQAKELEIPNVELVKLSHRNRLVKVWQGVYRIIYYTPTPLDRYAEAVTIVGDEAYIYSESVLAMHGLAFINPTVLFVATPKRIRKSLPKYIKTIKVKNLNQTTYYEGILSQNVTSAIITCSKHIMTNRIENAINEAVKQGLITHNDVIYLKKELSL
jgi:predicted transcriptional regulator of viral defense system